jgi:signal recognition particle subunit SRP54
MFETLSDKLQRSFKTLRGQGTLTDDNIDDALREIRSALLDSDVNLDVARDLIEHIRAKALGTAVATALSPAEQFVKIVRDELIATLGTDTARFKFASKPPSVILMAGLQGSGKTTTSGKLAAWLKKGGHRPMLVSVDVYRPAAREQLKVVAANPSAPNSTKANSTLRTGAPRLDSETLPAPTSSASPKKPSAPPATTPATSSSSTPPAASASTRPSWTRWPSSKRALPLRDPLRRRRHDRPGRRRLRQGLQRPLAITGAILTKMDGDSRGGAALSIRQITGAPIKFLGTGEKPDAFEPFHPDRIVSRILGMGDLATLLERADEKLDKSKASAFASKALSGEGFSLEDFREQLRQIQKLGSMQSILKMLPSVGPMAGMQQAAAANVDEKQFTRVAVIIDSMTKKERANSAIINGSRRKRIAQGAGVQVSEVNNVLKQHAQMSKMFKTMGSGGSKMQQRLMSQMGGGQRFGRIDAANDRLFQKVGTTAVSENIVRPWVN